MNKGPLGGARILVTRPDDQSGELIAAIEAAGGEAIRFPVIRIVPRDAADTARDLGTIVRPDIIIFVSRNAVVHGLGCLRDFGAAIAAVGPATASAIEAAGVRVDILPTVAFDSEHLLETPELRDVAGKGVLIIRGETGRELIADTLSRRGASVSYLPVYRRERNELPAMQILAIARDLGALRIDAVTVMSVETLEALLALLPRNAHAALRETLLVAPGDRVIQTAAELVPGMPAIRAAGPSAADIVNALIEWRTPDKPDD
ncbi:MAG: uroporphyrinogen-III synthase [Gammaproteobacteria bacterium]|nr:uroporphyrinogen-III synthase [Gammaproteobacteria bacterium]